MDYTWKSLSKIAYFFFDNQLFLIFNLYFIEVDYQEINNGLAISYFSKKWKLNAAGIFQGPVIGMQFLIYFGTLFILLIFE